MPWKKKTGWWVSECRSVRVHALAPLPTTLSAHGEKTGFDRGGDEGNPLVCVARPCVRFAESRHALFQPHASSTRRMPTCRPQYRRLPRPPGPHEAQRRLTRASQPWLTSRALVPPRPQCFCVLRPLACSHATAAATAAAAHSACRRASASPCRVQAIGPTGPVGP
jgi:hypothetical protein